MRVLLAALLMAALVIPASARGGRQPAGQAQNSAEQKKKSRAEETAYKDALRRIPNQKPADPWAKVR